MLRVQSGPSSSSLVALSTLTAAMAVLFDRPLAPPPAGVTDGNGGGERRRMRRKRGKGRGRRYSWDAGGVESPMEGMDGSLGWWRAVNNKNGRPLLGGATQHNATHICCAFGPRDPRARLGGHPCDPCTHTWLKAKRKKAASSQFSRTSLSESLYFLISDILYSLYLYLIVIVGVYAISLTRLI